MMRPFITSATDQTSWKPPAPGCVSTHQPRNEVFSGGGGIVYRIDNADDLYWYKHHGYHDGTPGWTGPKHIGNGWKGGRLVFSGGEGVIYFVDSQG